ncbi:uncharacterized protein [Magallana gigas]|uniref:uncharacterized protein isoform X1 n=1 Tax=Magallana gigas TaxID=29159 RepID=UPI00333EDFAE
MKRGHSVDEFCVEGGITAKRRKTGRKKRDGKRHRYRVSTSLSPDSLTDSSVSTCATLPQCKTDTVATSHEINNAATYSGQETAVASACDLKAAYEIQSFNGFPVSETCSSTDIISQEDFLGVLHGLGSSYSLDEIDPQGQPLQWVVDKSSSFLVRQHDQVFLTVVPGIVEASTQETETLVNTEPITDLAIQPSDSISYSQHFSTKSFSDKIKERLENWYFATMEVDEKASALMKYPTHLLEWSERVKFTHVRKWQQLEYHAPDYGKFD